MYKDIGGKIKHAAYIIFAIQAILCAAMGLIYISEKDITGFFYLSFWHIVFMDLVMDDLWFWRTD